MSKSKIARRMQEELESSIRAAGEENITLIRYNSSTGESWRITPDGKVEPYNLGPDQSDWARNAAMTDEEIEAAIASDPDEANLDDDWMEQGTVVHVEDTSVSKKRKVA
jgi:hypothetical protein